MSSTLSEKWKRKKKFDNFCTCGGYAYTINGRNPDQPHMEWCKQFDEYSEYYKNKEPR